VQLLGTGWATSLPLCIQELCKGRHSHLQPSTSFATSPVRPTLQAPAGRTPSIKPSGPDLPVPGASA
jgi:hypothetical protein